MAGEEAEQVVSSLMPSSSFSILVYKILSPKVDHILWAIQGSGLSNLTRNATYSRVALCVRVKCDRYSADNNFKYALGPHL